MRVLVVSDVHANLAALEAVLAGPHDALLCLGDLVGFGPHPGACVSRVRDLARVAVQGDYDRAAAEGLPAADRGPLRGLAAATAPLAQRDLTEGDRAYLSALPRWAITAELGPRCLLVHGTPVDVLYGAVNLERASWSADLAGIRADIILVGQTHRQFNLTAGQTRVVCPGSVGLPLDGVPTAAYAVIDDGVIMLRRVEYPVERTIGALRRAGLSDAAFRGLARILRSGSPPEDDVTGRRSLPERDPFWGSALR